MEMLKTAIFSCICILEIHAQTLTCQVNGGVVSCPPVACPGDQVTFIGTASLYLGNNVWKLPNGTCSSSDTIDRIVLDQSKDFCRGDTSSCGPFTASNVDPGPSVYCLSSNLTVTVTSNMFTSLIQFGAENVQAQAVTYNTSRLVVTGSPGIPSISANTTDMAWLVVAITPSPIGGLPTSYTAIISNSSYTSSPVVITAATNMSATVSFTGLRNDSFYNISAAAINCAGTSGTSRIQTFVSFTSVDANTVDGTAYACLSLAGIASAVSSVLSFSLGVLITSLVVCGCYIYPIHNKVTHSQHTGEMDLHRTTVSMKEIVNISDNLAYGTLMKAGN